MICSRPAALTSLVNGDSALVLRNKACGSTERPIVKFLIKIYGSETP